jgi:hypothetical protein
LEIKRKKKVTIQPLSWRLRQKDHKFKASLSYIVQIYLKKKKKERKKKEK